MSRITTNSGVYADYKNITSRPISQAPVDPVLCAALFALLALGLIFVASAGVTVAERTYGDPLYFLVRHGAYLAFGLVLAGLVFSQSLARVQAAAPLLLVIALVLLIVVLIPGLGQMVNGSRRWLGVGLFNVQPSELMKLATVIFMAAYLARHQEEVRTSLRAFVTPLALLGGATVLLMLEPDFGATAVLAATVLGMMFLAGMRLWPFGLMLGAVIGALATLAVVAPYRMERLTSFMNPWADPFNSGFQLTQALIAFGRGGWFGVGLGGSVQKLNYLPEAHTDFVFAVLAEELGLIGTLTVVALFAIVVARALRIAWRAERVGEMFPAYLAYGIALWLGMQALINIGVNMGVLPTKGLTLPLLSYGGSSLVVTLIVCAVLLRVDYETRKARRVRA